jgi:hypothetical protein
MAHAPLVSRHFPPGNCAAAVMHINGLNTSWPRASGGEDGRPARLFQFQKEVKYKKEVYLEHHSHNQYSF